ncbi:beta strand repeat-containing protein [Spongiivirga citrea]|uniref:Uncharacterized protein n=1 Tax=Spongiivirga citrea TaxID=1481457 RepID=A0A6M0CL59_9FLAO|nr:hypothetical protein [Spongiivirga citrea]NER18611.1 hypothetical protein [Spongiivirga citrea]
MKKRLTLVFLLITCATSLYSQVKVGDNPDQIDNASILELESADRVFVLTRVTDAQMNAITPLNGAMVYNIDLDCIFQYVNSAWTSLCGALTNETVTTVVDNSDGTFTYTNEDNIAVIIEKARFIDNGDGTFTFNNGGAPVAIDTNNVLTTFALNADGRTLEYTDENGALTSVNLETIIDNFETNTSVAVDAAAGNLFYVDENGVTNTIDLGALVAAQESLTVFALNADGKTLEYTAEDGLTTTIDLETIIDNFETNTSVAVDAAGGNLFYVDEDGVTNTVDLAALIAAQETLTIFSLNADGKTLEYTDEDGVLNSVDLETVINNFETNTSLTVDATAGTLTYNDENGTANIVDLTALVAAQEATTVLSATGSTLTYTDENGLDTNITNITRSVNGINPTADGNVTLGVGDITGLDLTAADASITVTNGAGATLTNSNIQVSDGGITTAKLADDAVTAVKINGDVAGSGLTQNASGALDVDFAAIAGAISGDATISPAGVLDLTNGAVETDEIADDAVTATKINADVAGSGLTQNVGTGALEVDVSSLTGDGDITSTDLTVTGGTDATFTDVTLEIAAGAVGTTELADDAVTTAKILDANVTTAKLADDSVTATKINADVAGSGLTQNVGTGALEVDVSSLTGDGDITSTDLTVTGGTDATFTVVTLEIAAGAVSTTELADDAVTTAKILDANVTTAKLADDSVTATKINADVAGSGLTQNVGTGALEVDVSSLTGDGDITSTDLTVTGGTDATFTDVTLEIAAGAVGTTELADDAVTTAKILDGNVTTAKIADDAITTAKILDANVTTAKLADDSVTATKINADVAGSGLTQNVGTGALEVDVSSLTGDGDITSTDLTVTGGTDATFTDVTLEIAAGAVGTTELADDAVTTAKVLDGNVTTTKILDNNVTLSKIVDGGADQVLTTDGTGNPQWEDKTDLEHTGTAGSVFFASDADGTPTENNAQFFYDETNTRLFLGPRLVTGINNELNVNGSTRTGGLNNSDGTVNLPSYRFTDDSNTGMFRPAADQLGFTAGGAEGMRIKATQEIQLAGYGEDNTDTQVTAAKQPDAGLAVDTAGNVIEVPTVFATGKVASAGGGTIFNATAVRNSLGNYTVSWTPDIGTNYIIQLSQPGRGGAGNDDPGISYNNQLGTSFDVIIGDNDNGGTARARYDSEFMFTIIRVPGF